MGLLNLALTLPLPDAVYRFGIHRQLKQRLAQLRKQYTQYTLVQHAAYLRTQPIAVETDKANEQHYEIPADFFGYIMGTHRKYSCCYFESDSTPLDEAEQAMLALTCARAGIQGKQQILELGCGWGSLTLYMAQAYPDAVITAVSNSASQKAYIIEAAAARGLHNIQVITANIATLEMPADQFDRIISVEMVEHVRNYGLLFKTIARWLKDDGRVFIHSFGHRKWAYCFDSDRSWMAKYFFSGGQMPARHLFRQFKTDLKIVQEWSVSGTHYAQTCRHWLENFDANKAAIMPILQELYGPKAAQYYTYWRLFFMACEALFAYNYGNEWLVYHYQFAKRLDCVA